MPAPIAQLTHDVLTLSETDRARLAQALLRSLEPAQEENVEEAWDEEVARRLQRVREGSATGRSAEEVLRDIRAEHQK
jgi:putative addiction module component (TIGR02574 family)